MGYDTANRRMMGMARGNTSVPKSAMVLAAGLGTRMRPYNGHMPKPLVEVGGKASDRLFARPACGSRRSRAVVNVHHLADALVQHLASRRHPQIVISDEREALLGTGGGIAKALPQLGGGPFFLVNSDTVWLDGVRPNFTRLAETFDPAIMDALLLLGADAGSIGYSGRGDFAMLPEGLCAGAPKKKWCRSSMPAPPSSRRTCLPISGRRVFPDTPVRRAAEKGRLFGLRLEGVWMHVGTPEAVAAAEAALARTLESARPSGLPEPDMPSRVFNIPASAPFLPTLLDALRNGKLGFEVADDPLAWAAATLYLPTRRACRLAREAFLEVTKTDAAILPRIVAIGDIDEDEIAFAEAATGEPSPPTRWRCRRRSTVLERRLLLTSS
jgi:MurNAc alpha-1-phosphate uridylyltransferase